MNCLLLTLSFYLSVLNMFAQSLDRFVIGSAGSSAQNGDVMLSFTVGDAVVFGFSTDDLLLSQGFQQAVIEDITTGIELPSYADKIIAYPNPVSSILYLDIHGTEKVKLSLEMHDINGRQLWLHHQFSVNFGHIQDQLDLSSLPPGIYLLTVKAEQAIPIKVFKIQKF